MLKILVDRALMQHISFLFDGISFDARSIHVLCSRHNNRCKHLFPDFRSIHYFPLTLRQLRFSGIHHKQSACLLFNKIIRRFLLFFAQQKISKRYRWKTEFFAYVISRKRSANQQKQLRNDVFHVIPSQSAKN